MDTNNQPQVQQSKYHPLSLEDFLFFKRELGGINNFLPEHLMTRFWTACNVLRGQHVAQPCSCASSARHWGSCVEDLNKWVKEHDEA